MRVILSTIAVMGFLCAPAWAVRTELPADAVIWDGQSTAAMPAKRSSQLGAAVRAALLAGKGEDATVLIASEPSPLVREWVAMQQLEALQAGPPLAAAGALLDWAEAQPIRVFRQHDETAAPAFLPMFDIAQRARDLRRLWAQRGERERWAERLARAPDSAIAGLPGRDREAQARAAEAVELLDSAGFDALSSAARAAPAAVPAALWQAMAIRRPTADWLQRALDSGDAAERLKTIALAARLPDAEAEAVLAPLETDSELGSAATLALVPKRLAGQRFDALGAALADPRRRDATAAGLARAAGLGTYGKELDLLHAGIGGEQGQGGWQRFLILLDDPALRARWAREVPR